MPDVRRALFQWPIGVRFLHSKSIVPRCKKKLCCYDYRAMRTRNADTAPVSHSLWPTVEHHLPQLWRTVRAYEANLSLQEELMQEVLFAIWQSLDRLRDHERLLPFVLRIAHNLGASHVRHQVAAPQRVPLTDEGGALVAEPASDPLDADSRWLLDALRQLPVPMRQVLLLQLEGFDYQEMAELLGISVENVGVRAHRARKKLQEIHDVDR